MPLESMKNCAAGLLFLLLLMPLFSHATHLRAGEITVTRSNCSSLTFTITITAYTNTKSSIKFGDGLLDFGDGTTHVTRGEQPVTQIGSPDDGIGMVVYSISHTFPTYGSYTISYLEPNRNANILNIFNSVETRFYLETKIILDPLLGCNDSPRLLVPPIDNACSGSAWFHNPGAYDPNKDSISFQMTVPKREKGQFVGNYRDPNNSEFYLGSYNEANENGDGPPTFSIDSRTGTITWDAPGRVGEYNIAFLIIEWRRFGDKWVQMGYVTRDMQILVDDCENERPELEVPQDICVEAGTLIDTKIFGFDPDFDSVKIEAFSQVFSIDPPRATLTPNPARFQKTDASTKASVDFKWQTDCIHVKQQPYQVVFKITDRPAKGARLVQFKTWNITVVGPAPVWDDATVDMQTRTASLTWDAYGCANATTMQIWRRVDSFPFVPGECLTGMPDFLGFTKIAEVPITQTQPYKDGNLAVGAQYCYRLVAVFPSPGGGESYVSEEICLPPIDDDAPVITNVTVDKTASEAGEITVRWTRPYDYDPAQFFPPFEYKIWRAEGFNGTAKLELLNPGKLTDTVFVDKNDPELNTENVVYNYRVVAFDANGAELDTSAVASTVRLEAKPQLAKIDLVWTADVPWSMDTEEFNKHYIYRDNNDALVLIDSVNVNQSGFTYSDDGRFNGVPLDANTIYCYRVRTLGSYGNDRILKPLINFSQKICAQPADTIPPCKPDLKVTPVTCEARLAETSCDFSVSNNVITWTRPTDPACANDVVSYNVYVSLKKGAEFNLLVENVRDTFYVHEKLTSAARCYKIEAVDRSGNRSEMSEQFCFDNCPYYELPNVFTPDGDECNKYFSAFSARIKVGEGGFGPCSSEVPVDLENLRMRCARYVLAVQFKVYNRWGLEVYNYHGDVFGTGGEKSIFIDWDGKDSQGVDLSEGVYYYVAEVTYDVVDPSESVKTMKGWVHLVR